MDLQLDDVKGFVTIIKQVDQYSFLIYFSFLLPLFYVVICKLLGVDEAEPPKQLDVNNIQTTTQQVISIPADAIKSLLNFFTVKNAPGRKFIFFISFLSFLAGMTILVFHGIKVTRIQRNALQVRSFMAANYYSQFDIRNLRLMNEVTSAELIETFPNDFVVTNAPDTGNKPAMEVLMLIEPASLKSSIRFSTQLLESYLSSNASIGHRIIIDDLYWANSDYFTRQYVYELIALKPYKYALGDSAGIPTITLLYKDTVTKDK